MKKIWRIMEWIYWFVTDRINWDIMGAGLASIFLLTAFVYLLIEGIKKCINPATESPNWIASGVGFPLFPGFAHFMFALIALGLWFGVMYRYKKTKNQV